jgi:hypothetical protein
MRARYSSNAAGAVKTRSPRQILNMLRWGIRRGSRDPAPGIDFAADRPLPPRGNRGGRSRGAPCREREGSYDVNIGPRIAAPAVPAPRAIAIDRRAERAEDGIPGARPEIFSPADRKEF